MRELLIVVCPRLRASLIQSAKLNGIDPFAYLKDLLTRLPTQPAYTIQELLPHCWKPAC